MVRNAALQMVVLTLYCNFDNIHRFTEDSLCFSPHELEPRLQLPFDNLSYISLTFAGPIVLAMARLAERNVRSSLVSTFLVHALELSGDE